MPEERNFEVEGMTRLNFLSWEKMHDIQKQQKGANHIFFSRDSKKLQSYNLETKMYCLYLERSVLSLLKFYH